MNYEITLIDERYNQRVKLENYSCTTLSDAMTHVKRKYGTALKQTLPDKLVEFKELYTNKIHKIDLSVVINR